MASNTVSIFIKAKDQASPAMEKVAGSTSRMSQAIKRSAAVVAAAASAVIAASTVMGVKTAADLESSRQGFITLLGSASKADKVLAQIKKDAKKTPFEMPGLISANQMLTSVTKDGFKSERILMNVGKALAAMGKGQPELDRLIVNLQQIGAVGHASMLDIKQFAFAGVPIFDMLTKATGKSGEALNDMISNGEVTFEMLTEMFQKAGEGSGQFADAFKNQSGTFKQLVSNMKDSWKIFMADFVQRIGLFDLAKDAMQGLIDVMSGNLSPELSYAKAKFMEIYTAVANYLGPKLQTLWTVITTQLGPTLVKLWKNIIQPLVPVIGIALVGALGLAIDSFALLLQIVTPVINFLSNHRTTVYALATAFIALRLAMAFNKVAATFNLSMASIRAAIALTRTKVVALRSVAGKTIVMSIAIGAALAALEVVYNKYLETKALIEQVEANRERFRRSAVKQNNKMLWYLQHGTAAQKKRARSAIDKGYMSIGFASGGFTGRGSSNQVAGVVHKGEYVLPQKAVDQTTGQPKAMGHTVVIENYNSYHERDDQRFLRDIGFALGAA